MKVSLLTGGADKPYALGLLDALASRGMMVDFIANDEMSTASNIKHQTVNVLNLRGDQSSSASRVQKSIRVLRYYLRLIKYSISTDAKIFHILWFNKFVFFDRTLLNMFYKALGKKLVFTAHNIDEKQRDGGGSSIHRLSLRILYALVDHIFVHTTKMKSQLIQEFGVAEAKVSIIPFGINNMIPKSSLSKAEARANLGLDNQGKVLLFFGLIAPYKGLEFLLYALDILRGKDETFKLIIAGQIKDCESYWKKVEGIIEERKLDKCIIRTIQYIPDSDVEVYFKASDVLILPYRFIFQSGVLFLSYSFGLPVIATDVGSMKEDIIDGKTGMICRPEDPHDLARVTARYFESELYRNLDEHMKDIISYGNSKYSWDEIGKVTEYVYQSFSAKSGEKMVSEIR